MDWQLWDYAWRASQHYGKPVLWIRRHLIVLSPRAKAFVQLVRIKPQNVAQWAQSAMLFWEDMARDDKLPFEALPMRQIECINRYGKCPAYDACHSLLRDETKMEGLYVQRT